MYEGSKVELASKDEMPSLGAPEPDEKVWASCFFPKFRLLLCWKLWPSAVSSSQVVLTLSPSVPGQDPPPARQPFSGPPPLQCLRHSPFSGRPFQCSDPLWGAHSHLGGVPSLWTPGASTPRGISAPLFSRPERLSTKQEGLLSFEHCKGSLGPGPSAPHV